VEELPIATQIIIRSKPALIWSLTLLFLCHIGGCEKRELIEPTPGMDFSERYQIRVLLFDNIRECSLASESDFSVIDTETKTQADFTNHSSTVTVRIREGKIIVGEHSFGGKVEIRSSSPFVLRINGALYRGNLTLIADSEGMFFDAINVVPLEAYLAGVVGAEMPSYWEPEALKAQAIACRTYCLNIKNRYGSGRNWDVRKTQAHQVYKGIAAESRTIWDAVNETKGMVLLCDNYRGAECIFPAYYSSTCGGYTEYSKNVFGDSYESLVPVECPYCRNVAKMSYYFWPMVKFDVDQVSSKLISHYPKLANLQKIVDVEPSKTSRYGSVSRIVSVKLVGKNGKSESLRGEDFRLTVDPTGTKIKSMACQMVKSKGKFVFSGGRGFGHGVGMCQYGAQGMARKGKMYDEILAYYYPGSHTVRVF
jgi:stage II sporulation protein D